MPAVPTPPLHLLIVDDEPLLRNGLSRSLRSAYQISLASSGKEALRLLATGRRCDVVLSDLLMPEMNGAELLEALSQTRPELCERFILMTGAPDAIVEYPTLRDVPCLHKPFARPELAELIQSVLAGSALRIEAGGVAHTRR